MLGEAALVGMLTATGPVLFRYAASLPATTSCSRWPAGNWCTMPGKVIVTGFLTSTTRAGDTRRCTKVTVPSGATSYSFTNSSTRPAAYADWVTVAVGARTCRVTVGMPATRSDFVNGSLVHAANVPGASRGGVSESETMLPCSADVSL